MKKFAYLPIIMFSFFVNAQSENRSGIIFQTFPEWEQVVLKANAEFKYIFVDIYATWCGPCRQMDKEVYLSTKIGAITNGKFICIKIQLDKTSSDNMQIKSWYNQAEAMAKTYNIDILPTLLVFSPTGKLIDKVEGYQDEEGLIKLLQKSLVTKSGYYDLIEEYKNGRFIYRQMGDLALKAKKMGDRELADSIAINYKSNYLFNLSDSALFTAENLKFISNFASLIHVGDRFFGFFYHYGKEAERLAGTREGYSDDIIKFAISNDEIYDFIYKDGVVIIAEPDWVRLYATIARKYKKEYAEILIPAAKFRFFNDTKNWKEYSAEFERLINLYPPKPDGHFLGGMIDDVWELNSKAWILFLNCSDSIVLKKALRWSELSIQLAISNNNDITQYLDTKANLLYKIGDIEKAIITEELAYKITKTNFEKAGKKGGGEELLTTIDKMKRGIPTWPLLN